VARPFDRSCDVPAAGSLDTAHGQFWVGNPWRIVVEGKNLSAYERNRTFLNLGDNQFADVSFLTQTDSDGDGRSAFGADLDGDGMQDLVVRQAGGGPLLLFQNRFPRQHYLRVSLRGTKSNGLGIGARLVASVGDRTLVRDMFPADTFKSQSPCEVHFGLGDSSRVDRLTIHWPSGLKQELTDIPADQHLSVVEGESIPSVLSARR
jgi:hypothetical protein